MVRDWPLVGRDQEVATLRRALGDRKARGSVVVSGEAGVGKTRLVREALAWARTAGWASEWTVGSHELSSVPLGPFAHLFGSDAEPAGGAGGAGPDLVDRVVKQLRREAGDRSLVVAVDDAHELDPLSVDLLLRVRQELATVVLTVRSAEPGSERIGALADHESERLDVQPLSRADCEEMLCAVLGGQIETATMAKLWSATRGNPMFVRELVLSTTAAGTLVETDGMWHERGPLITLGGRLGDLISARLAALNEGERATIELLAIAEPLGSDVVRQLQGDEPVERLEADGLIGTEPSPDGSQFRLTHPLYGEAVRARMPRARAREVQRTVADVLMRQGEVPASHVVSVARWQMEGSDAPSPDLLLAAARRLLSAPSPTVVARTDRSFDTPAADDHAVIAGPGEDPFALAARLAARAMRAGGGVKAGLVALHALRSGGRPADADRVFAEAMELATTADERVELAHARARISAESGDFRGAETLIDEALAWESTAGARASLRVLRSGIAIVRGRLRDSLRHLQEVIDDPEVSEGVRLAALASSATSLAYLGSSSRAIQILDDNMPRVLEMMSSRLDLVGAFATARCQALLFGGRLEDADEFAEMCAAIAGERGQRQYVPLIALTRGWAQMLQGHVADGRRWFAEAAIGLRMQNSYEYLGSALAELAICCAQLGDLDGAQQAAAELATVGRGPDLALHTDGWLAAASGNTDAGAELLLDAAEHARLHEHAAAEGLRLLDAARVGAARRAEHHLEALVASGCDARWTHPAMLFAKGAAREDGAVLDEASAAFEQVPMLLVAAEASVLASLAHRRAGLAMRSREAAARGQRLLASCQGAVTPILRQAMEPPELTRRERDVARLAAHGLSDREIADQLRISYRTVESHLHHVYDKLGARGRDDLPRLLDAGS